MEVVLVAIFSSLGTAGLLLYAVIKYYNNVRTFIKDVLAFLASTVGWFKSTTTKLEIETNGVKSIERLNRIVPELGLPDLSIEWVNTDQHGQVRLEPGKAIVLLKYNKDNTQNIINTAAAYVHKTLLFNSKAYMDKGIHTAIDFTVIREFLNKTSQKNYIVTQFIESCSDDIDLYSDAFQKVIKVEDEGLLTRVLLREYAVWGNKLAGKPRSLEYVRESKQFLDFIYNIASRDFDELTPLVYSDKTIKVAVLLVAKYDTYTEKGIEPYVRRIREGFANGINTFYLLARNDKIEILNQVYGEIIATGNYNLLNGPEVYKDNIGRDNICYCIEIRSDADIAKAYVDINNCINDEIVIEAFVSKVFRDNIKCEYNGLVLTVPRKEISENHELRLKSYYAPGMMIEVVPLRVIERGEVECSMLKTNSNPQKLFDSKYEVGTTVTAIVENADDDFINLRVKDSDQQGVAYRRDLTPSRFAFLHLLFPVGKEFDFTIKDIDYIYNKLILAYNGVIDPWANVKIRQDDEVEFEIFNIKETCVETELGEGLFAILPYSELSWLEPEIEGKKRGLRRSTRIKARVKKIIPEDRLIILTCREKVSPYLAFFESLGDSKETMVKITTISSYGVHGFADNKYKVFIPSSETHIGENRFNCHTGRIYKTRILEVDKLGKSFVGSFKPYIIHPFQRLSSFLHEGQILSHLQYLRGTEYGAYFKIKYDKNKSVEALLLSKEVSSWCFIKNLDLIFSQQYSCPMVLKEINMERGVVLLSIKELSRMNQERINSTDYGKEYSGMVLGREHNYYSVLLDNIWIEVKVESDSYLAIGDKVNIIKASSNMFVVS